MSKPISPRSTNTSSTIIDLLAEQRIKLEALEYVLKETNPLVHELYLGTIEKLQAQKAAESKRPLTGSIESRRSKPKR